MPDAPITLFISYSHADSSFVDRLEADLRKQGFDPWVDRERLVGGVRWRRELQEAVKRAQVLLIVLSPDAVASQNVQIEYEYVLDLGKVLIPIYYRQCDMPMELRAIQWIDFRHSYEEGINALVQALHRQQDQTTSTASSASTSPSATGALPSRQEHVGAQLITPSKPEAERPWNVPFARNPFFTGRSQLLERLHAQFSRSPSGALTQSYALSGLGGIGKTQMAIEYAYRYRQEYSAVFWVRADSRETLVADFVAIAWLLGLPGHDAQDQLLIVAAVKRRLEQHAGWLLVLDNADALQLLTDFLPVAGQGHLLLTTRVQATGKIAQSLSVEKMEPSEGMQLLLHRAKLLDPEEPLDNTSAAVRKAAQQLVSELDGLPLALDQAGAYIEETSCSLLEYLQLYAQRQFALLQQQSSMSIDYRHTVASTWALSFVQVEEENPAACDLLQLCAFLHPDCIPEAILTEGAAELGPLLAPVAADPLLLNRAIQLLRRYSLVKRDADAKVLNIHRLVQVVVKESLDAQVQRQWAERSVRAVNRAFPEVEFASWERCELCLPHALLCAQLIEQYGFTFPEAARLLHAAGIYLRDHARYAHAEPLLKQALSLREQVLGPEHPETASTLNALADLYVLHGEYEQAELLLQPALARFERVLGPEHPEVATTLHILANLYLYESKYVRAEPLMQRALNTREQVLGPTHPDVAESLEGMANLYSMQGKYAQAELLYQRALTIEEQTLGSEDPKTLVTMSNLALLYAHQAKYAESERLQQRALATNERLVGHEHTSTAANLLYLGYLYTLQGKYTQAEPLLQRALMLHERALEPENIYTINSLHYLAILSQAMGRDGQAESLYQQAIALYERVKGLENPLTAEALTNLAQLYTRQGRYDQAKALLERSLTILYTPRGHYDQAKALLEGSLTIDEQVVGPQQPRIAMVLDAQGHLALLQGREEQAERLLQQALAIREQALGSSHPDVAQTLHHLAQLYEKQGKHEQARTLYQRALSIREQALGPDHPDTIATRDALTRLLQMFQAQEQQDLTSRHESIPPA